LLETFAVLNTLSVSVDRFRTRARWSKDAGSSAVGKDELEEIEGGGEGGKVELERENLAALVSDLSCKAAGERRVWTCRSL
jgi:hypothetical protein